MGNKNRNLIIAYFENAHAADTVAQALKHWDKDHKEIKLGGMGIITEEEGKLKTHKVGARATGTGAKWGTILGATGGLATGVMVAAGVLTGGIGLIPGAIAGLAVGAVGGALFHKRIGMTDEDRARLEDHLRGGGAALAVMADDPEVEATKAEIAALGGAVENYLIPDEVMDEFEETTDIIEDAQDVVEERFSELELEAQEDMAALIAAVSSIDAAIASNLRTAGVTNVQSLLDKAATPEGRAELAAATGYDAGTILAWANQLDLERVRGVGPKYAALLKLAGVDTVPELAQRNPANLAARLAEVNATDGVVKVVPTQDHVANWIGQAKELPRVIVY